MTIYFWLSFALSLWCLLHVPSRMSGADNLYGSAVCALFGFALWPLFVVAAWKSRKR